MASKLKLNEVVLTSPNGLVEKSITMGDDGIVKVDGLQVANMVSGTFTPIIVGDGVAGVGTYLYQYGRYTKIGNTINFVINIATSAHTGTGNMIINGLPFVHASVQWLGTPCAIASAVLTYPNQLTAVVVSSSIIPYTISSGGGETKVPIDATTYLTISGTYQTT